MKILGVYDNGESLDRYTVVFDVVERIIIVSKKLYMCLAMSEQPFHPQGFGQHSSAMLGRHLGKKIKLKDLPEDCRKLVAQELA